MSVQTQPFPDRINFDEKPDNLDKTSEKTEEVASVDQATQKELEIEALTLSILLMYSKNLEKQMFDTMKKVDVLQKDIKKMQDLLSKINALTDEKTGGLTLDLTSNKELYDLLKKAKELGVELPKPLLDHLESATNFYNDLEELRCKLNENLNDDFEFDFSKPEERLHLIEVAKELNIDVSKELEKSVKDANKGKLVLTLPKYDRDALVENVNLVVKDLNTEFSLQAKKADRLNSERTEVMKYAFMVLKSLHDIFMKFIRLMKGPTARS